MLEHNLFNIQAKLVSFSVLVSHSLCTSNSPAAVGGADWCEYSGSFISTCLGLGASQGPSKDFSKLSQSCILTENSMNYNVSLVCERCGEF